MTSAACTNELSVSLRTRSKSRIVSTIAGNALELVGRTEMVRLNRVTAGARATVVAKLESQNPGGSVKDRIGVSVMEEAEARKLITPGRTVIIEPTSGSRS